MIKKYCTIRDLNYVGEITHGTIDGDGGEFYTFDDGDIYPPDVLQILGAEFSDEDPRESKP